MRRARYVKRRKTAVLNTLFLASMLLFYETHGGVFLRDFAVREVSKFLPEGSTVSIGAIEGGIFKNLVTENVRVYAEGKAPVFEMERMEIKYRLWYPLLKRIPGLNHLSEERKIIIFVGKEKKDLLKGFLEIEGTSEELDVSGYLGGAGKDTLFIKGVVNTKAPSHLRVTKKKGFIDLDVEKKKDLFLISGRINHMKLAEIDIVGEFVATVRTKNKNLIDTRLAFKNLIINYAPFKSDVEIFSSYDKEKEMFDISKFRIGDDLEGSGYAQARDPYYVFLKWNVTDLAIEDYYKPKEPKKSASGLINGTFSLKGPISEAEFQGHADVQNGSMGTIRFDSIIANLKGKGPVISIYDTRILKEGGYMTLEGDIDLSKIGEDKMFEGVSFSPGENFFIWDQWSVKKETGDSSLVKMEKALDKGEEFRLSFKSKPEKIKSEKEDFLGVEHKVKF